jgi:CO/xanthine dehydrogenase Mo-binding subunit
LESRYLSIESVLINRPGTEVTGGGETAITPVAAAIGNAMFDATGARVRRVPFQGTVSQPWNPVDGTVAKYLL